MATGRKKILNFILVDASGSMGSKKTEVIGGLKLLFDQIKQDAKKKKASIRTIVVDFSGTKDYRVLVDTTAPEKDLTNEVAESYEVRGFTALYDAIGTAFSTIKEEKFDGAFISILTDGEENDSKEYDYYAIREVISEAREKKWAITFMGTSEAEIDAAKKLGVSAANTILYSNSKVGTASAFKQMGNTRGLYVSAIMDDKEIDPDNLI